MFENLLHIGNKKNYWNPKMKNYIYGTVNGVHVINLTQTVTKLEEVKNELKELHSNGKKILFVGTKLQARDAITKMAIDTGHFYVSEKWVPGLLTNFKTIKRRIATYLKLIKDSESGAMDVLTKKEKAAKMLELEKLDRAFKGLKEMKAAPDAIFVVDGIYEDQAVREANSLRIPAFAIMNTNGDDTVVKNLIPANTNSVKSLDYITSALSKELVGTKVSAAGKGGRVQKMDQTKISGEKTAPAAKAAVTKAPAVKAAAPVKEAPVVKAPEAPIAPVEVAKEA